MTELPNFEDSNGEMRHTGHSEQMGQIGQMGQMGQTGQTQNDLLDGGAKKIHRRPLKTGVLQPLPKEIQSKWFGEGHGIFARMGVNGEGSCFFHSVLTILNPHDFINIPEKKQIQMANEFRKRFSDMFTIDDFNTLTHVTKYKGTSKLHSSPARITAGTRKQFEKAQKMFKDPKVWADETNIRIVSKLLNLNLVFVDFSKSSSVYCHVHGDESIQNMDECHSTRDLQKTGIVAWIDKTHFEPIVRIDNATTGKITTLFDPRSAEDALFLTHFMTVYRRECKV
jgi:hypothetical protein